MLNAVHVGRTAGRRTVGYAVRHARSGEGEHRASKTERGGISGLALVRMACNDVRPHTILGIEVHYLDPYAALPRGTVLPSNLRPRRHPFSG